MESLSPEQVFLLQRGEGFYSSVRKTLFRAISQKKKVLCSLKKKGNPGTDYGRGFATRKESSKGSEEKTRSEAERGGGDLEEGGRKLR